MNKPVGRKISILFKKGKWTLITNPGISRTPGCFEFHLHTDLIRSEGETWWPNIFISYTMYEVCIIKLFCTATRCFQSPFKETLMGWILFKSKLWSQDWRIYAQDLQADKQEKRPAKYVNKPCESVSSWENVVWKHLLQHSVLPGEQISFFLSALWRDLVTV